MRQLLIQVPRGCGKQVLKTAKAFDGANIRFTRPEVQGQNTLLGVVYVQRQPGVTTTSEEIRTSLTRAIQMRLLDNDFSGGCRLNIPCCSPCKIYITWDGMAIIAL